MEKIPPMQIETKPQEPTLLSLSKLKKTYSRRRTCKGINKRLQFEGTIQKIGITNSFNHHSGCEWPEIEEMRKPNQKEPKKEEKEKISFPETTSKRQQESPGEGNP
ncbi:hypothetical protein MA16_Dca007608 [Dendrobium catenatum]|uniref:Uncharacterized protein n=1 Tax=Dendrobium catenatum TaxID=906689 RepID=A0A2I0X0S4_9ASPA|nr:hypothetical protein MA16_Dca007608 [Dendrobium catenatum]